MIFTLRKSAEPALAEEAIPAFDALVANIPDRYRALLAPTLQLQAERLGISVEQARANPAEAAASRYLSRGARTQVVAAELFTDGANLVACALRQGVRPRPRRGGRVQVELDPNVSAWIYTLSQSPTPDALDEITALFGDAVKVRFEPYYYENERLTELIGEGMQACSTPAPAELGASRVLAGKDERTMALAIKASGGLLISDVAKQLDAESRGRAEQVQETLRTNGLVDSETVVVCRRTHAQVARVPNREVLDRLAAEGLKCACGASIASEQIEDALAPNDLLRALLDGNRWFSLLLVEELAALGVRRERIAIEQQVGGDEIDCVADISGELVLFELKDKEFNLGNAYSFGAKIAIIRPQHPVVVSSEYVGEDAKEHFSRIGAPAEPRFVLEAGVDGGRRQVRYIEGLGALSSGLAALAGEIYERDASTVLADVLSFAAVDPATVIRSVAARADGSSTPSNGGRSRRRAAAAPT